MQAKSQRPKGSNGVIPSLNTAIEALNLAKDASNIARARAIYGSVTVLLTMIRDTTVKKSDYVELGLACADVCGVLDRGMGGRRLDELNPTVCEAIDQLTTTVAEIQGKIVEKKDRGLFSRLSRAKNEKEAVAAWKLDLIRILQVFNTELALDTHTIVFDMHQNMLKGSEDTKDKNQTTQIRVLGESPPSPPRLCFGRDELIEMIVDLAKDLTPVALIGAGGIGKTNIALTVLHNDRIKQRFGDNRRFVRCDQFPATPAHFLARLSKVTGASVENPEDLSTLSPFLSSKEMLIVLDNAESILDPQGTNAREMYALVEELTQLETIFLCITSRITTIPPDCETFNIPTLSMEAACATFYRIYKDDERSELINNILERLDFHPLSITLLATVAHHNQWDTDRLTREWERRRTDVLHTEHNKSLAATIELSLASPMFQELGPDARGLLGVVAFLPQGVDENNLGWLFPTTSNGTNIFDKFCILSLTYRSNGFVTMLAPLRDYLRPKDPNLSPLLSTTKKCYFSRLSVTADPDTPGFEETRWITSEDVNTEHLLDVFTSIDPEAGDIWDTCAHFMEHLYWHKRRVVILGPKIKRLRDDHPSKPQCLVELSRLFEAVGNIAERKELLSHALKLQRGRGDDRRAAQTLRRLSDTNRLMGLRKEGIQQAGEASEIYKQLGDTMGQAQCLRGHARLLYEDKQLDAAEEVASRAINLMQENSKGHHFPVCRCHRLLGDVYRSKGKKEEAIRHFETALGIASSFNWRDQLVRIHYSLAGLFSDEGRFDDAHAHVERAKSHVVNDSYFLGRTMELQAGFWYQQRRFEEAKSEARRATDIYEKLGAAKNVEDCRELLRRIDREMNDTQGTE